MDIDLKTEELKVYELSFLIEDPVISEKILNLLKQFNAEIVLNKQPEKINLAYPIKKQNQAFFGFVYFKALPEQIIEIDKILHQEKDLLRFMIIKDPIIKDNKNTQNKKSHNLNIKEKNNFDHLTNEALEKKLEEILEEK
ncbi:MAG: 30S ribosomal protein S6 [Patescibacteria group bacterium]|nr:30S ribosomal protein S6 [Patescibacteria group bacterium]MCX7589768.1 30S ribosomal protein S6 [Patescibacteria group bacterium]MDW8279725.1 30S ribosomal protein S6 [bacterium]